MTGDEQGRVVHTLGPYSALRGTPCALCHEPFQDRDVVTERVLGDNPHDALHGLPVYVHVRCLPPEPG